MKSEKSLVYANEEDKELKFINEGEQPLGYNPVIYKSNCLIQSSGRNTKYELNLYNVFHLIAGEELRIDPEKKVFTTKLKDLKNYAWINGKDNKRLREVILSLMNTKITYDIFNLNNQLTARWVFSILQEVKVFIWENGEVSENSLVEFQFSDRVLETIVKPLQSGGYTKLKMSCLKNLGYYGGILYQNLKAYEYLIKNWQRREISLEDFRKLTNTRDILPDFWNLKKKVLEQAKKEINGKDEDGDPLTDIIMNYRLKKTWRKITGISFSFDNNPKFKIKWFKETKKEEKERVEVETQIERETTKKARDEVFWKVIDDIWVIADTLGTESEEDKRIKVFNKIFEKRPIPCDNAKSLKAFNNLLDSGEVDLESLETKALNYIERKQEHPEIYANNMINRIEKGIYRQNLKSSKAIVKSKQLPLLNDTKEEITIDKDEDFITL